MSHRFDVHDMVIPCVFMRVDMDSSHRHIDIDIQSECVVCEWSYLLDLYHRGHHTSIDIENKSFTEFMFYIDVVVM